MATAEKALIEHDETEIQHENTEEIQHVDKGDLKDTKYSWFVCCCTFLTQVFILGVLHAFGVFFVEFLKEFKSPKGKAAWVGSLAYGLSMTFGPVTSMLVRKYGNHKVMMCGGAICAVSIVISSFATSIIQLFATFSVLYGIGTCMAIGPTMTMANDYFDKYHTIATGIIVSGSSFGTLIMGPLSQLIIDSLGWRSAFRIYAALHVLTIILNSRIRPPRQHSYQLENKSSFLYDLQIWKNRVFVVWTLAITMVMFGFYIPYVHLVSYAMDQGISADRASMLMMVLGATTASGRLLFGKIVQLGVLNRLHMHQLSMVVTGTGVMMLPLIKSYIGIIMYVVVVGLVDGCYVVLLPILTTSLVGIENSVLAWGFLIGTSSITFTLGPPVAGALYDVTGSYDVAFHCAGIPIVSGAIILFFIPWAKRTSSLPNVMDVVHGAVFRANSTSEPDVVPDQGAMIATVEDVIQTIAIPTSSFITVRSVATSTDEKMFHKEKSTSTCTSLSTSNYKYVDIEEAVSQLSQTSEPNRSFTSERIRPHGAESEHYVPRIPPPSDPGRCYYIANQDRVSMTSSKAGSSVARDSSSRPSFHSSLTSGLIQESTGFINDSLSTERFLPSPGQLLNLSSALVPPSDSQSTEESSQSRIDSFSGQQAFVSSGRSATEEPAVVTKSEDEFEQTISNQVEKLLETLKIPSPEEAFGYTMDETTTEETETVVISKSKPSQNDTDSSGIVYDQIPQRLRIMPRIEEISATHDDIFQPFQVAGPSKLPALSAPHPYHGSPELRPTENSTAHSFGSENQLTVIPSQNPFTKNKPRPGAKLEELFTEPESVADKVEESMSFEVLEVNSSDNVRQTPSTGEIDVFKHLFDDEDNKDGNEGNLQS